MLVAILVLGILTLFAFVSGFNELNRRIINLDIAVDEIKEKTDKLGTNSYK